MKYIDLSHKLNKKTMVYPNDPNFSLKNISDNKEEYNLLKLESGLHTGTHIDAPYHYFNDGKKVFNIDLERLIGKASILEINSQNQNQKYDNFTNHSTKHENRNKNKKIDIDDLKITKNQIEKIIILKTGWFHNWGNENYFYENPYITKDLAKLFVENNIYGIAIDSPSVDKYNNNVIHKILLKNNIWIVENITNTDKLEKNSYESFFIPMKIEAEASFIRAFIKL